MGWQKRLDGVAAVAMTVAAGVLIWAHLKPDGSSPLAPPKDPIPVDLASTRGDPEAPVAIVGFSDYQCPYCGVFETQILPELDREFIQTGQVLFSLRHLPLESIHPLAKAAAVSVVCAGQQGRFWDMHDSIFQNANTLQGNRLSTLEAGLVGLDAKSHAECTQS